MDTRETDVLAHSFFDMLKSLLNQEGFRLTHQREKILNVFQDVAMGDHLSAEVIYQKLSDQGENIGLSTIYRALHLMVDLGVLRELTLPEGRHYYELSTPFDHQHHHLVCTQCGSLGEFDADLITQIGMQEAMKQGFSLLSCQFTVLGICPKCLGSC